jgi:hypothetical protein
VAAGNVITQAAVTVPSLAAPSQIDRSPAKSISPMKVRLPPMQSWMDCSEGNL